MSRKPAYYNELNDRLTQIEKNQGEQMDAIQQIHYLLAGTEYEKGDGGLVGDVGKLKKDVKGLKTWKTRIVAIGSTISAILGGLFTIFIARIK